MNTGYLMSYIYDNITKLDLSNRNLTELPVTFFDSLTFGEAMYCIAILLKTKKCNASHYLTKGETFEESDGFL